MFKKLMELKEIGILMLNTFQAYLYRKTKSSLKHILKQLQTCLKHLLTAQMDFKYEF